MTIYNEQSSSVTQYDRHVPFPAKITYRQLLNKSGSSKKTYHIGLDLGDSGISYRPGDAIGIFPENNLKDVERIIQLLDWNHHVSIINKKTGLLQTIQNFLTKQANLHKITPNLCALLGIAYDASDDVLSCVEKKAAVTIQPQEFCDCILPMMPRFYSIASSQYVGQNQVDLLVVTFEYEHGGRLQSGLGSSFLCEKAYLNETIVPIYVHTNDTFKLPDDETDIILIGPGTGVAPYRAFLQERMFFEAKGRNWLFFGERNARNDFYFESFWKELCSQNKLKLNTAFSRDQAEKRYVQHEMLDCGNELYEWIEGGAIIYVCGDAKNMAKDVAEAFTQIIADYGNMDLSAAKDVIKQLRKEKRYLQDVY